MGSQLFAAPIGPDRTLAPDFLAGGGDMGARIRAFDWAATPLGPPARWPQSLRSALSICLGSSFPTAIYWGPELTLLYNDAWAPIPADRHPWALGRPGAEVWADIWDVVGPQFEEVLRTGEGFAAYDQLLMMERRGVPAETWWNYSFTPIRGEDGRVVGVFNQGNEVTDKVLGERRAGLLLDLADRLRGASSRDAIAAEAARIVGEHLGADRVGYAEIDEAGEVATIAPGWAGQAGPGAPRAFRLHEFGDAFAAELRAGRTVVIDDMAADGRTGVARGRFRALGVGALIAAPVCEAGRLAAALFASFAGPRRWLNADARLIEEAAERTRAAAERARADWARSESERRLRLVLDSVSDGFYALDAGWRFTLFNSASERYFGRPRDEVLGRTLWEVFPEAAGTEFEQRFREIMAGGAPVTFEARSAVRPGRAVEMRAAAKPGGGMALSFSDVTERAAAERALAEAVEAKDVLLHEVNHRVKNSLQIVTSLLMLQMGQAKDPALRQALGEARSRIAVVAAMHQRLYSTSQHDRVDFGDYLRDMAAETLHSLGGDGRVALEVDAETGIVVLLTHAVPLALVVSELVTNAVKYAFPGGRTGRLRVAIRREGDGVAIEVADDGVGLAQDFDPKKSGGLGMRIVTALVRQVRGTLEIEGAAPGARFRVVAPEALTEVEGSTA